MQLSSVIFISLLAFCTALPTTVYNDLEDLHNNTAYETFNRTFDYDDGSNSTMHSLQDDYTIANQTSNTTDVFGSTSVTTTGDYRDMDSKFRLFYLC